MRNANGGGDIRLLEAQIGTRHYAAFGWYHAAFGWHHAAFGWYHAAFGWHHATLDWQAHEKLLYGQSDRKDQP